MKAMNQKEKIIAAYQDENIVKTFNEKRSHEIFHKEKHRIEREMIEQGIKQFKGKKIKILDVACGTGRFIKEILTKYPNVEYHCLDSSKTMINELQKNNPEFKKQIKTYIGDATKLPFKEEFDFIFTYHLTWHLPINLQKDMVREMLKATKKEGVILFDVLNPEFLYEKIKKVKGIPATEGIYKPSPKQVRAWLKGHKILNKRGITDAQISNKLKYFITTSIPNKILKRGSCLHHMVYYLVKK